MSLFKKKQPSLVESSSSLPSSTASPDKTPVPTKKVSVAMSVDENYHVPVETPRDTSTKPIDSTAGRLQLGVASTMVEENKNKYRLSDFKMLQTLGTGTFGRVLLCKYRKTDQFYAMKMLKKAEVVRLKQVEHINSEKEILAQINHPFLVNLYCTFQDDRNLYMLLEYVVGGELFSHLRRAGKFSNETTMIYAGEIVLALEYLHSLDIIYRDLKPENLLLDEEGHIRITDFGFAKKVEDRTWTLCGTPEYLAPEIIQSKGHGKAVDWWALGILIYEMLAGFPPFYDDHPFGIYEKILAGKIVFPPHFDPLAKDLIKKLLTADRTKRIGNLKNGAEDVRKHKWFKPIDWEKLFEREIDGPIQIKASHAGDTRNFDKYPEVNLEEEMRPTGDDPFKNLFKTF